MLMHWRYVFLAITHLYTCAIAVLWNGRKYVPECISGNPSALVQAEGWYQLGNKPLLETMMTWPLTPFWHMTQIEDIKTTSMVKEKYNVLGKNKHYLRHENKANKKQGTIISGDICNYNKNVLMHKDNEKTMKKGVFPYTWMKLTNQL